MKKIILPSLALLAVLASSAQAQSRKFEDVPLGSCPYSAVNQFLQIEDRNRPFVTRLLTRYEFAVATANWNKKFSTEEQLLPTSKMGDILLALNREFDDEIRELHEEANTKQCIHATIIEKSPEPTPMKDQVRTTFLRRKVEAQPTIAENEAEATPTKS